MTPKDITAEQLVAVLKFTPRTYKIQMWGYGGEKVMGTVSKEVWDYCNDNQVDLSDIAWSDEETVEEDMGLELDRLPFTPGSWYECDNMAHVNGVSRNAGTVQVTDENDETVFERSFDDCDGCDDSPEWCCNDEAWVGSRKAGEVVFIGSSNEKGTFFEGEIELTAPFDITKLQLGYDDVDGEEIINSVYYNEEEIDNWGGSTDGKSSDFDMVLLTDDAGNFERYEPEEKDWGHPEYGTGPSEWEKSPTFDFKKYKPQYPGYYNCVWTNFGTTYGSAYWDGKDFGEWEHGKFNAISGVQTWSGFNWDTTSWVNRPPEPSGLSCDNKKCTWVGKSDDRRTDEDFTDHCPDCDGTEFSWIDYDPDTKEGRANREKYCTKATS